MGLVTIPGGLWIPKPIAPSTAIGSALIDATAEKVAFVFRVPKTGTLDKFEFRLGAVTQAPSNGLRCSFQDVSAANGDPDGTQDQLRDVTSGLTANAWIVPGLITSDGTDTGAKRSVTVGQLLSAVVEFTSFNASDSLNISYWSNSGLDLENYQGYLDFFTAAWGKSHSPLFALKYNDGTYGYLPSTVPYSAITTTAFNSGSTPDERALYFSFPVAVSIGGAVVYYSSGAAGRDADIVLYDSDGTTALETIAIDGDQVSAVGTLGRAFVPFSQNRDLAASTFYRLAVKPSSANSVSVRDYDVASAAILDATEGGQNFHFSSRTDAGAWSQTTTKRPLISLLVTRIHDGTGGGGGGLRVAGRGGLIGRA